MREIKFRAWNNIDSKMLQYSDIVDSAFFYMCVNERYNMMQYTGLKDKNGVEIYEGDIVNIFGNEPIEVIFKSGAFGYMTGGKYSYFVSIAGNPHINELESIWIDLEVIGNIYENPELLEQS